MGKLYDKRAFVIIIFISVAIVSIPNETFARITLPIIKHL